MYPCAGRFVLVALISIRMVILTSVIYSQVIIGSGMILMETVMETITFLLQDIKMLHLEERNGTIALITTAYQHEITLLDAQILISMGGQILKMLL